MRFGVRYSPLFAKNTGLGTATVGGGKVLNAELVLHEPSDGRQLWVKLEAMSNNVTWPKWLSFAALTPFEHTLSWR